MCKKCSEFMCEYDCECIFCMCKYNLFFVILFCKIEFCMCKCICICMCKDFSFGATPGCYSAMVCWRRHRGWSGGWQQLELFYEDLFLYGPGFGYFPHPAKYKVMRWRMILCWYLYKCVRRNAKIKSTTKNTRPHKIELLAALIHYCHCCDCTGIVRILMRSWILCFKVYYIMLLKNSVVDIFLKLLIIIFNTEAAF